MIALQVKATLEHATLLKFFELRAQRGFSPFNGSYFAGMAGDRSPAATQVAADSPPNSCSSDASVSSGGSSVRSPPDKVPKKLGF